MKITTILLLNLSLLNSKKLDLISLQTWSALNEDQELTISQDFLQLDEEINEDEEEEETES